MSKDVSQPEIDDFNDDTGVEVDSAAVAVAVEETPEPEAPEATQEEVADFNDDGEKPAAEPASKEPEKAPAPSEADQLREQLKQAQELLQKLATGAPLVELPPSEGAKSSNPELDALRREIAELKARSAQQTAPAETPEPDSWAIDEKTYDKILSDPAEFGKFMKAKEAEMFERLQAKAVENALSQIPELVMPMMNQYVDTKMELQNWVTQNPVVQQNRELAAAIVNQVDSQTPGWTTAQKLEAATKLLNQHLSPAAAAPQQTAAPAIPSAVATPPSGGKPAAPKLSDLQNDLDSLNGYQ